MFENTVRKAIFQRLVNAFFLALSLPALFICFPAQALHFPFDPGETWVICQGYQTTKIDHFDGTITYYDSETKTTKTKMGVGKYSLDFVTDKDGAINSPLCQRQTGLGATLGKVILAPASGTLNFGKTGEYVCLTLDTPENGIASIALSHLAGTGKPRPDIHVSRGQFIGNIGIPSIPIKTEDKLAHLHMSAWASPACKDNIPFGNSFFGYDLSSLGDTDYQHYGKKVIAPAVYPLAHNQNEPIPAIKTGTEAGTVAIAWAGSFAAVAKVEVTIPWCSNCSSFLDSITKLDIAPTNKKTPFALADWPSITPLNSIDKDRLLTGIRLNVLTPNLLQNTVTSEQGIRRLWSDFDRPMKIKLLDDSSHEIWSTNYPFSDVPVEHNASCYINYLWKINAIKGKAQGRFDPEGNITRAEFIKIVMALRFPGSFSISTPSAYKDVSQNSGWVPYLNLAKSNGYLSLLTTSCNNPRFNLEAPDTSVVDGEACIETNREITRLEAVSILAQAYDLQLNQSGDEFNQRWRDVDAIKSTVAAQYIYKVASNFGNAGCFLGKEAIVNGNGSSDFGIKNNLTRAEAAKIIALSFTKVPAN